MPLFLNQLAIAIKSAVRNFRKNLLYSSLNLLGMSIAFATVILVTAYVYQETNYENFHTNADRIYRPTYHIQGANNFDLHFARIPVDFINELPTVFPEIEQLIRFQNKEQKYVRIGEKRFKPKHAYTTDAEVFQVFSLPLLLGNPQTALSQPKSVVISESLAEKYFSHTQVIGEEMRITGANTEEEQVFFVTAVMKDVPVNTHLPIEMLFSFANEEARSGWAYVYTLLKKGVSMATIATKLPEFIQQHTDPESQNQITFDFQPLKDIHLHSHLAREIQPNGQAQYISIFFWTGLFVWLIALVNFTNLSTALALARGKEIGVRKVLGASKTSLAIFTLTETIVYSLIALGFGMLLAITVFPAFSRLTDISLWPPLPFFLPGLIGLAVLSGLLAGVLPAGMLASLKILQTLKTGNNWSMQKKESALNVRQIMITLQFAATIMLMGSAWVAQRQFSFIQHKNLGLEKDQILTIPEVPHAVKLKYPVFKNALQDISGIQAISACMQLPSSAIRDMGPVNVSGQETRAHQPRMMDMQIIDPDFITMMEIELLAGEDFSKNIVMKPVPEFSDDYTVATYLHESPRKYFINETAMRQLGWQTPSSAIGQQINWSIGPFELAYGPIAGVIKDFHQESLRHTIDPVIMTVEPLWLGNFLIKIDTKNMEATLAAIEDVWNGLFPYPFDYAFLDERYNQLYQQDRAQLKLLGMLATIAILISFLGVISLVAYALERRSRELAIRRVIGANLINLTRLMGKEYFWVLAMAAIIGIPTSYYFSTTWLQNFAYRVEVPLLVYLMTVLLLLCLLVITIYWQTFRATTANPVEKLREE